MRSLHIVLPARVAFDLTPRHLLLLCATLAMVCLLSLYVQAIHASMARGVQLQAEREAAASVRRDHAEVRGAKAIPLKAAWAIDRVQQHRYSPKTLAVQG